MSNFDELMAGVSDEILIAKAREWADRLEADGGAYRMSIPPYRYDPDIVFSELADRYEEQHGDKDLVNVVRMVEQHIRDNVNRCRDDAGSMRIYMGSIRLMCNQFFV